MLHFLSIKNYAIINSLEITFNKGFSTITGETGSGKSIIIGALSLLLGKRSGTNTLKDKNKKCIVEAHFNIENINIKNFFAENELDFENPSIVRREILPNGKTRSFINDTPVQVSTLKNFGKIIIDIHSQHQNLDLQNNIFQLKVLDAFAKNNNLTGEFLAKYHKYKKTEKQYQDLIDTANKTKSDLDYYTYQYNQIEKLNLIENEQEEIETTLAELNNAEEIKSKLFAIYHELDYQDDSIIGKLTTLKNNVSKLSGVFSKAEEFTNRLESTIVELKDIAAEAEQQEEKIIYNPEQIEKLSERLSEIFDLQQKHRVDSIKKLIEIKNNLEQKIKTINSYDREIKNLKKEKENKEKELHTFAQKIHAKRKQAIPVFESKINSLLKNLGMPNAVFTIKISEDTNLNEFGKDLINFLFSANQKIKPGDITKIASGGELSRLMLALKYTIFDSSIISSIIFDEIDLGVSGEIADKMGQLMAEMAEKNQVICITHLPQIASRGQFQYSVTKHENKNDVNPTIDLLNNEERVIEIAKMLSAKDLTDAAIENAKILLKNH